MPSSTSPDARPGVVAEHADRAGDSPRALLWSLRAAQAAEEVYAWDEAHRQYVRVRRLWPSVPDAEALVGLRRCRRVLARRGDRRHLRPRRRRRRDHRRGPVLAAGRPGRRPGPARRRSRRSTHGSCSTAVAPMPPWSRPAGRSTWCRPTRRRPERGVVVSGLVHVLDWAGGGADWEPLADEAVEVARATGDSAALARALVIRTHRAPGVPGVVARRPRGRGLALAGRRLRARRPDLQQPGRLPACAGLGRDGIDAAAVGMAAATSRGLGTRYGSWLARRPPSSRCATAGGTRPRRFVAAGAGAHPPRAGLNRDYALVCGPGCRRCAATGTGWTRRLAGSTGCRRCSTAPVRDARRRQLWRGDPDAALATVASTPARPTPRLIALSAPLAWLGLPRPGRRRCRPPPDRVRRRPGGPGWDETVAMIDDPRRARLRDRRGAGLRPAAGARAVRRGALAATDEGPGVPPWQAAVDALVTADGPTCSGLRPVAARPGPGGRAQPRQRPPRACDWPTRTPAGWEPPRCWPRSRHLHGVPGSTSGRRSGCPPVRRRRCTPHHPRAGDPRAPRRRPHQRRDRQGAGDQHQDRQRARLQHPAEAGRPTRYEAAEIAERYLAD